ncbi:MAG: HAMP domain-containing sensor histidine kinase [Myxococcota bacterium]
MATRTYRSISGPIVLGATSVALSIVMLVGWILVMVQNFQLTKRYVANTWLLIAGVVSLAAIISVLVLFSVFLVREILEVRRQTRFIDSVTHELRSPLASISLGIQTLERAGLERQDAAEVRRRMRLDVERLSLFIEEVLDASRLDQGPRPLNVSDFDLRDLVERAVDVVARRHEVAPQSVEVAVEEGLALRTDQTALDTVIRNLLDNAIKYSDRPPRVRVEGRRVGDDLVIEVADQGIGIPVGLTKRVFERFYRVPEEAVRSRRGTGLGLYVVQALVRGIGGKLTAKSEGVGRGTTMHITLPSSRVLRQESA